MSFYYDGELHAKPEYPREVKFDFVKHWVCREVVMREYQKCLEEEWANKAELDSYITAYLTENLLTKNSTYNHKVLHVASIAISQYFSQKGNGSIVSQPGFKGWPEIDTSRESS
tara:strand:+ start:3595 stop:3936 length:342 start_codon:yes stop_codon:yes gene_type:complete